MILPRAHYWLLAIWACFIARGAFYAAMLPLWEGFDEWAHFAVIQRVALRGELLPSPTSKISRNVSASLELAPVPWELRHLSPASMTEDLYWQQSAHERYRRESIFYGLPSSWANQDASTALAAYEGLQAPLYYWAMAPFLFCVRNIDLGTQVLLLRLLGVAIASLVIPFAFLIGLTTLQSDVLALGCAAIIAAMPEFAIDVARVGNECVAVVLFTILTLLLVRSVGVQLTSRRSLAIGALLGCGLLSKAYFLSSIPAVLLVLAINAWRDRHRFRRLTLYVLLVASSSFLIAGWWYLRMWWTPFSGQKSDASLDGGAALKMKESQCPEPERITRPA